MLRHGNQILKTGVSRGEAGRNQCLIFAIKCHSRRKLYVGNFHTFYKQVKLNQGNTISRSFAKRFCSILITLCYIIIDVSVILGVPKVFFSPDFRSVISFFLSRTVLLKYSTIHIYKKIGLQQIHCNLQIFLYHDINNEFYQHISKNGERPLQ